MSTLAGRPPFATDEPDSFYQTPNPQRRVRQAPPPDPNSRTSAYNHYENYVGDEKHRQSGIDALGHGFMTGSMDDDDGDYDDKKLLSAKEKEAAEADKHSKLAAATGVRRQQTPSPPPQYIASPRPGYAAPIDALNNLSKPEPAAAPGGRQALNNASRNPFQSSFEAQREMSMPVPQTPHPLQPPMSPITPVFARPRKEVQIVENEKEIMRGQKEDTTLPSRGERGDDFWRRFSMVVKEENKKPSQSKTSMWLKKTQSGTNRMSRLLFCIGIFLVIIAAGAIGLGWWAAHNDDSHNQPTAIGGSAQEAGHSTSSVNAGGTASVQSSLHVSPTNTVARREVSEAQPTLLPNLFERSLHHHKSHLNRLRDLD
ncbi:hypothetical protein D9758_002486 [Tetrapyrgos nigripes]|uniref:Uncharacterized protein n=1 Tax=Tetrapyrgos nigripes TaxID=182062 RepID=A0A8H5LU25_9AGAR|nr:hypothetical protein D9758_002486 [Tetrapyrgos nigripes]